MFSLICAWINGWVNNREVGDLRCHRAHHDVTVMHLVTTRLYGSLMTHICVCEFGHHWTCPLFSAKALSKPKPTYCQLDHNEPTTVKFESNQSTSHWVKCVKNCRLQNTFCSGFDVLNVCQTKIGTGWSYCQRKTWQSWTKELKNFTIVHICSRQGTYWVWGQISNVNKE